MLGLKQWLISRFYLKYSLLEQKILECSQLVFSLKVQQEFIFYIVKGCYEKGAVV